MSYWHYTLSAVSITLYPININFRVESLKRTQILTNVWRICCCILTRSQKWRRSFKKKSQVCENLMLFERKLTEFRSLSISASLSFSLDWVAARALVASSLSLLTSSWNRTSSASTSRWDLASSSSCRFRSYSSCCWNELSCWYLCSDSWTRRVWRLNSGKYEKASKIKQKNVELLRAKYFTAWLQQTTQGSWPAP